MRVEVDRGLRPGQGLLQDSRVLLDHIKANRDAHVSPLSAGRIVSGKL